MTGDGTRPCKSCAVSPTLPDVHPEPISNPDNWKNNGVECHYSRTSRRYRGSTKGKTQHLQERLGHAERLLRTAGLIDQLSLPSPSTASQNRSRLGVLPQATSLPRDSVGLGDCYGPDVPRDPVTGHDHAALHECHQLVESSLAAVSSVGRQARNLDSISNQQSITGFPYFRPFAIDPESSSSASHLALPPTTAAPSSTQDNTSISAHFESIPAAASETIAVPSQDPDQQVDAEEPV